VTPPTEVELLEVQLRAALGDVAAGRLIASLRRQHPFARPLADAMLAALQQVTE
jgi:hypothetical protein